MTVPVFWTTRQLADRVHVHPATVRTWLTTGRVAGVRPAGRWLIPEDEVRRILTVGFGQ
jgi:excisionase family DNA binding protein